MSTIGRITAHRRVVRYRAGARPARAEDTVTVEEPLEIRVGGQPLAVTMRTPGHDVELAIGFLVSEGVIATADQVHTARFCAGAADDGANTYNVLDVELAPGVAAPDPGVARNFYTTSSCGVCGKASIDAIRTRSTFAVRDDPLRLAPDRVLALPDRLRAAQTIFDKTGGLHAAGLFDGESGELLVVREDVGRHNAVDKVVGWATQQSRLPLRSTVLMVSGRASFELTQKALMAGIPVLAAVSAPSSLAVDLAADAGLTLVGFVRDESMVVYSGSHRVGSDTAHTTAGHTTSRQGSAA